MNNTPSLTSTINQAIDTLITTIQNRPANNKKLDWLLENTHNYMADYRNFHTHGLSTLKQRLNRVLYTLSPRLWQWLTYSTIKKQTDKALNRLYKPFLTQQNHNKHYTEFLNIIKKAIYTNPKAIGQLTFTDYYAFIKTCINGYISTYNFPTDPYKQKKERHNKSMLPIYKILRTELPQHPKKHEILLYLCTKSNWLDVTARYNEKTQALNFKEEINEILDTKSSLQILSTLYPHFQLQHTMNKLFSKTIKTVLYESDNSGEILMDLLLIEALIHEGKTVILSVKNSPILNDMTYKDTTTLLSYPELEHLRPFIESKQFQIIKSGSDSIGQSPYSASDAYKQAYKQSDIVILKGQGHFQTMPMGQIKGHTFYPYKYHKPFIMMMLVKANRIHRYLKDLYRKNPPPLNSPFMRLYDPENPSTYPKL